jgi:hypothetical protein
MKITSFRGALLQRAALVDTCEAILGEAEKRARGLSPDEQRSFDEHANKVREINAALAEYKRERIAGIVEMGIPAEHARFPF